MEPKTKATDVGKGVWVLVFGSIAVLYVAFSLLDKPVQTIITRYQLGKAEEQDQLEAYRHWDPGFIKKTDKDVGGAAPGRIGALALPKGADSQLGSLLARAPNKGNSPIVASLIALAPSSSDDSLLVASLGASSGDDQTGPAGQPNCVNPHPGSFSTSYGARNGCWVQVWRHFPDGCVHYQWLNSCAKTWDAGPDGMPKVYWTQCRH